MNDGHDRQQTSTPPMLIHLTVGPELLARIMRHGVLRAMGSRGAAYNHRALRGSQLVVSLSEIDLADLHRLAARHGQFGLGFRRRWAQHRGAAPVWYLPRGSQVQMRIFEIVKSLGYGPDPVMDHFLWELTPFIDYPRDGSTYDWRWEREWRVRGHLKFSPTDVAALFAPEDSHDTLRGLWLGKCSIPTKA